MLIPYIKYFPGIRRAEILSSPSTAPFTSFQSPSPINLVSWNSIQVCLSTASQLPLPHLSSLIRASAIVLTALLIMSLKSLTSITLPNSIAMKFKPWLTKPFIPVPIPAFHFGFMLPHTSLHRVILPYFDFFVLPTDVL